MSVHQKVLDNWGNGVKCTEKLTGGVANDVWSVELDGEIAVARFGTRSDDDLTWEASLLQYLDSEGMRVPVPIPTSDGRF